MEQVEYGAASDIVGALRKKTLRQPTTGKDAIVEAQGEAE
jgi:hypothetical protein